MQLNLNVPVGATCLSFDYRFFSEEFPDNVGGSVNDGFVAMLDSPGGTADPNGDISAPTNFAVDEDGDLISVNTAAMTTDAATGTPFGGATSLLTASKSITAGAHTLYLAIFDQGDNVLDSAVFIDNLRFSDLTPDECDAAIDRIPPEVTLDTPAGGSEQSSSIPFSGTARRGGDRLEGRRRSRSTPATR